MGGKPTFGMDGNTRWAIDPGRIYFHCLFFLFPQPIFEPTREAQSHLHAYRGTDVGFWIGSSREGSSSAVVQQYMEEQLVAANELFDRIIAKGHYTERTAALICTAIVHVVHICHAKGVMHRDLKPDLNGGPISDLMRSSVAATKWVINSERVGEKGGNLKNSFLKKSFVSFSLRVVFTMIEGPHLFVKVPIRSGNFCICLVAIGIIVEVIVFHPIHHHTHTFGIGNLLVLLIGGILIAMPIIFSITMDVGFRRFSQQDDITKRVTVIEEMGGMEALSSDKIWLLFIQGWCTTMEVAHTVEPKPGPILNGFYK